uniref:Protein kinase domain-containing protein n=1 Tax=Lotharella globosa TaxID=91324 RepID=A0A7S3ZFD9_9EUKA
MGAGSCHFGSRRSCPSIFSTSSETRRTSTTKEKDSKTKSKTTTSVSKTFTSEVWKQKTRFILSGEGIVEDVYCRGALLGEGKYLQLFKAKPSFLEDTEMCLYIVRAEVADEYLPYTSRVNKMLEILPPHANVVFSRSWEGPDKSKRLWRATEYCAGGSMKDVRSLGRLSEQHIAHALYCCVKALIHLHAHGVIHGSVSSYNLLMTSKFEVKLADLGVHDRFVPMPEDVKFVDFLELKGWTRNPEWIPPEGFNGEKATSKADIWALGITCLELANGGPPLDGMPLREIAEERIKHAPPQLINSEECTWSEIYQDFVRSCLIKNPNLRPTAEQLLCHDFLNLRNWSNMNGKSRSLSDVNAMCPRRSQIATSVY